MNKKKGPQATDSENNRSLIDSLGNFGEGSMGIVMENDDADAPEPLPETLPILPLKNTVLFPGIVMPITLGRSKSIKLVEQANKGNKTIGVVAQKNMVEDPSFSDLNKIGIVANILRVVVLPDGTNTLLIQGIRKIELRELVATEPYIIAEVQAAEDIKDEEEEKKVEVLLSTLKETANKLFSLSPEISQAAKFAFDNMNKPSGLVYFLASNITSSLEQKQEILEYNKLSDKILAVMKLLNQDIELAELKNQIHSKVSGDIDKQQREYFLRQQIRALQEELGDIDGSQSDYNVLEERAQKMKWPAEAEKHFKKEMEKLGRANSMSPEYGVLINYLEFMLNLPWKSYSKDNFSLKKAADILDADHYGLEKVKERILEYLAVLKLKQNLKGPILCLYGPPGVGKTSLGKSVAKALGRKYIRMSLGGVRDEAEIRGHRKTYIGAMPGRIIGNLKKVGTGNPVFILDEIDKIGNDFRGDPSAALLEVLDPEQNSTFVDNYLEVEYDLSKILFIATTNSLDTIHPALRDRMEIIEVSGYTLEEKIEIAKRHLVPKQIEENGLKADALTFEEGAIASIIEGYTRESGVRTLEREIGKVVRKIAKAQVMQEKNIAKHITKEKVSELLGAAIFEKELYQDNETAGIVTGLAWTSVGGEILFIETSLSKGNGKLTLSGQLGEVMKESAVTALSYLKANAEKLGIDYRVFNNYDAHIHIPAGAVPKDGPSAGITMLTSLASAFTQRKVRNKLAMTGEITLRGKVLPVGGIKEKILAAKRAGITDILLCSRNRRDIEEIPLAYIQDLNIHYVDSVDEVLSVALLSEQVTKPIDLTYLGEMNRTQQGNILH